MRANSDLNRKETPLDPKNNPPYTGPALDRRGSRRLSSRPESSLAWYLPAQLQAGERQPSAFPPGMLPLVPSDRSEFPLPSLEEDLTIGRQRHKRTVLSEISGPPQE